MRVEEFVEWCSEAGAGMDCLRAEWDWGGWEVESII